MMQLCILKMIRSLKSRISNYAGRLKIYKWNLKSKMLEVVTKHWEKLETAMEILKQSDGELNWIVSQSL